MTKTLTYLLAMTLIAGASLAARAAEFELRGEVRTAKSLLQLGDVAKIYAANPQDADKLAAIELMPTPAVGDRAVVGLRAIQDLLELRGLDLTKHTFSGPAQVTVVRTDAAAAETASRRPSRSRIRQAQRVAADAIVHYLRETVADEAWQVTVDVSGEQALLLMATPEPLPATGGRSPWVGRQTFELTVRTKQGPGRLNVTAQVALPPSIVVAIHAMPKGAIVRASDIELQRLAPGTSAPGSFRTPEEVVGKEAVKAIAPGQTLDANYVRPQVLVHAGEVVTVYGRNAGIVVRMPARARESGAQGELVTVESLLDRKSLLARVCGLQEVEVFGGAATTSPSVLAADRGSRSQRNE